MKNGELVLLGVGGAVVVAAWLLSNRARADAEDSAAGIEPGATSLADLFGGGAGGQFTGIGSEGQGEFSGTPAPFFGDPGPAIDGGDHVHDLGSPPAPADPPVIMEGGDEGAGAGPTPAPFFNRDVFQGLTPLDIAFVGSIAAGGTASVLAARSARKSAAAARVARPPPAPETPSTGTFKGRPGSSRVTTIQEAPGPTLTKGPPRAPEPTGVSRFRTVGRLARVGRAAGIAGAAIGTAITGAEVAGGIAADKPEQVAAAVGATPEQVAQRRAEGAPGFVRFFGENLFNVFVRQPIDAVASLVPSAQAAPTGQASFTAQRGPVPGIAVGGSAPRFPLLEAQQARILAERQARFDAQRAAAAPAPPPPPRPAPAPSRAPPPKTAVRTLPAPRSRQELTEAQRRLIAGV